jgi:asparagine synthase (glutamine-hydrolysing)
MCGISGYINIDGKALRDSGMILDMLREQKHRGPDDSGIMAFSLRSGRARELPVKVPAVIEEGFEGVLGFNRLSIMDLSINGHQPMVSPDGRVLLTLNGEIYNAFDFKKELQDSGYIFKSTSDTEVVLYLFLKYGLEGMLNRLNGMFAIVIADLREQKLLIIRDRYGIKPMYYLKNEKILAFSSELKSFTHLDDFAFELRHEQVNEYILFRNNLKGTLYKDIHSLLPGQYLAFSHSQGLVLKTFFDINTYNRKDIDSYGLNDYSKRIMSALDKSVKSQLMSDVKLGCQLSGGIDSSLVTLLANNDSEKGNFEAVSIVFKEPRFSEEKYIDLVTGQLGITSHKFLLDSDYYLENIEKATWHLEAPLNHPNTVAIYRLSQRAKEYVTVLLSGEGADEVFGGYERFYELSNPYRARILLNEVRRYSKSPGNLIRYFIPGFRAVMATSFIRPDLAGTILRGFDLENAIASRRSLFKSLDGSLFDRQIKYEIKSYLPDLLIRQDKMSMAHSIENRVPFLDNELVEESFGIPERLLMPNKLSGGNTEGKYLLKKISADVFGNDFAFRDKMGFGIPVRQFFSSTRFEEYLNDKVLPGIKSRGLFNYQLVSKWSSRINALDNSEIEAMWLVVAFEIWASLYLG